MEAILFRNIGWRKSFIEIYKTFDQLTLVVLLEVGIQVDVCEYFQRFAIMEFKRFQALPVIRIFIWML